MSKLKITLIKSTNKAKKNQIATVRALGLRKISQTVVQNDLGDTIKKLISVV